jgi:hypothetical protein
MNLSRRFTPIALGLAAILILGGSIAAAAVIPSLTAQPGTAQASPEAKEAPSAEKVKQILDRLGAAGITATADDFNALAQKYGVGGAVRVLAFAHAAGKTPADITAMFDGGKGWGQIRRELNLTISPGIGWIMGHGHDNADKAKADKARDEGDDDPEDD